MSISVLLVDDHKVVLEGFVARLESEAGIEVVGTASTGLEALEQAKKLAPDVVLMDVSMPVMNGLEATRQFKQQLPESKVLMLTMHDNREYIVQVMQSGALGYILKDVSADEMVKAIETVNQGGTYFCQAVAKTLFSQAEAVSAGGKTRALSRREETVLRMLALGNTSKQIAAELNLSVRTVETHRQNIKHKLELNSVAELAKYAIEHSLI